MAKLSLHLSAALGLAGRLQQWQDWGSSPPPPPLALERGQVAGQAEPSPRPYGLEGTALEAAETKQ